MTRVLVVEDDPALLRGLVDNLELAEFQVLSASDGETGFRLLRSEKPDVMVLDLMLPRMSGYDVCRKARADGIRTPILILSARGEEADRVLGLDLGADDYLAKPFSVRELVARVRALARRVEVPASLDELRFDDVVVNFRKYEATRDGRRVPMTRKEFAVLRALAAKAGEVITRDALLRDVWGYEVTPTTRTVDNHVGLLRSKIERDPASPRHLLTVHGIGYKWEP
jgi:DNA-binding response OmpR family regulator